MTGETLGEIVDAGIPSQKLYAQPLARKVNDERVERVLSSLTTRERAGQLILAYPQIIHMLMDRTHRQDMLKRVHPAVLERSTLGDLTREYSLYEICIITRSGPARILGLQN